MNMTPEQVKNWRRVMLIPESITDEEVQRLRDNTQKRIDEESKGLCKSCFGDCDYFMDGKCVCECHRRQNGKSIR